MPSPRDSGHVADRGAGHRPVLAGDQGRQPPVPLGSDSRWIRRTGQLVDGDIRAQTTRVLENIGELLKAGGADFSNVVRTTIFLADLADFATVNEIYATYFTPPYPARATVQVARLPRDVQVEIDAIAVLNHDTGNKARHRSRATHASPLPGRSLHSQHAFDTADRLDHLLQVLQVRDLDRHVDARVMIGARRRGFER